MASYYNLFSKDNQQRNPSFTVPYIDLFGLGKYDRQTIFVQSLKAKVKPYIRVTFYKIALFLKMSFHQTVILCAKVIIIYNFMLT